MPRLFTGVEIPADVAFELDLMKGGVLGARWVERDNYHITLRFIGDIAEGLAREIAGELDTISADPFTLRLKGIDAFGGRIVSYVYGVSTIGNVLGTLVTTFTLVPMFGSRALTMVFAAVTIACGLLMIVAERYLRGDKA